MAAPGIERIEAIERPGLSAAKSRAHLSTNAKTPDGATRHPGYDRWPTTRTAGDTRMIIDWHSHIYTPEEAVADLGTIDGKRGRAGTSAAVRW